MRHDPGIGDGEEARKPQTGDDDHHAEQQRDGIEVYRLVGILERQGARCDHEAGADQGDAGPVDAQAGNPADREREIASDKDDAGRDAPAILAIRSPAGSRVGANAAAMAIATTNPTSRTLKATGQRVLVGAS